MSIGNWLATLGMEEYTELFESERIDLDAARYLTDANLKDLGLPMGHRAKLLAAIAALESAQAGPPREAVVRSADGRDQEETEQGERRQLTVLFCDMVGFTELASRLDPEVLQKIIRVYEDTCAAAITRYDGYAFQRLGDGIVACCFSLKVGNMRPSLTSKNRSILRGHSRLSYGSCAPSQAWPACGKVRANTRKRLSF
jgi:class 3 adenylate cyclase